jgi:hypothetical protein
VYEHLHTIRLPLVYYYVLCCERYCWLQLGAEDGNQWVKFCRCVCVCVDFELLTYDSRFDINYEWERKVYGMTQTKSSVLSYNGEIYYRPRYRRAAGNVCGCPTTLLSIPRPALSKEV